MTFQLEPLLRENIKRLRSYSSAREEFIGEGAVLLDANELPDGFLSGPAYNRYPDPASRTLRSAVAAIKRVPQENIFAGHGSDECISLLLQLFVRPGLDTVLITTPSYGMYEVAARIQGAEVAAVKLNRQFHLDLGCMTQAQRANPKLTFICSPNNPTGNLLRLSDLEEVLQKSRGIVVVDEAYIDFAPSGSILPQLLAYPNLVVLQTLSKAWGLAALRVGFAFASAAIIDLLMKVKAPYNIGSNSQELALKALACQEQYQQTVAGIVSAREELSLALTSMPCVLQVYPSDANFLLVRFRNARFALEQLRNAKVIVRNRSDLPGCENCLRITVGTPNEHEALLSILREASL